MSTAGDILEFWFEAHGPKDHFAKSDAFDSAIRAKFEGQCLDFASDLMRASPHKMEETPDGALALIIALDQFPRNMYRGTRAMFAWDALSLGAANRAVDKGFDFKIAQDRRAFIYMPFMHSEDMSDQKRCVDLVESRLSGDDTLRHAKAHRKLIDRFGRFPHRNGILCRDSTADEIEFLETGGYAP